MRSAHKARPRSLADQLLTQAGEGEITAEEQAAAAEASFRTVPRALLIPIERITPSQDNPRRSFEHLDDLAESIAERGVLHPLVVRRDPERPGYYLTVAGARRLLAARIVQGDAEPAVRTRVATLPCVVAEETERDAFADALAENLARQDLSRAEVMVALLRLQQEYGWTARYIARRIGRSVSDVAELLGIAKDSDVAGLVRDEIITPTTAGQIRRLPTELRPAALEGVHTGRVKTVGDVQRLRRDHAAPPPRAGSSLATPPLQRSATPVAGVSDIGHPAPGGGSSAAPAGGPARALPQPGAAASPAETPVSDIGHPAQRVAGETGRVTSLAQPPHGAARSDLAAMAFTIAQAIEALPQHPPEVSPHDLALLRQARDDLSAFIARAEDAARSAGERSEAGAKTP